MDVSFFFFPCRPWRGRKTCWGFFSTVLFVALFRCDDPKAMHSRPPLSILLESCPWNPPHLHLLTVPFAVISIVFSPDIFFVYISLFSIQKDLPLGLRRPRLHHLDRLLHYSGPLHDLADRGPGPPGLVLLQRLLRLLERLPTHLRARPPKSPRHGRGARERQYQQEDAGRGGEIPFD